MAEGKRARVSKLFIRISNHSGRKSQNSFFKFWLILVQRTKSTVELHFQMQIKLQIIAGTSGLVLTGVGVLPLDENKIKTMGSPTHQHIHLAEGAALYEPRWSVYSQHRHKPGCQSSVWSGGRWAGGRRLSNSAFTRENVGGGVFRWITIMTYSW